MATKIFNPVNIPVISKLTIDNKTYYLKDAEVRDLLKTLGEAAQKDVAASVSAEEQGLVTGAQVQAAIANLTSAMHFVGVEETLPLTAKDGDVVIVDVKEYVYANNNWHELGDETLYALKTFKIGTQDLSGIFSLDTLKTDLGLGTLADKNSATGIVAGQTITGVKATGTSAGSIEVGLTQTSTAATLTKNDYTPSGNVTGSVTAAGSVSITKDANNGTQISGSVSAPTVTITPDTDSIKKVTSVGTLPTKDADTFTPNGDDIFTAGSQAIWSAKVDDASETLSFSFTANTLPTFIQGAKASYTEGTFYAGTLPELATKGTTVMTGVKSAEASAPVFTGDKFAASFTGASADITATFAGEKTSVVSGVNYDKATVDTSTTKFIGTTMELDVDDIVVAAKDVTVQ
jgi:hypothetical protein